jgi:hypothetical protein
LVDRKFVFFLGLDISLAPIHIYGFCMVTTKYKGGLPFGFQSIPKTIHTDMVWNHVGWERGVGEGGILHPAVDNILFKDKNLNELRKHNPSLSVHINPSSSSHLKFTTTIAILHHPIT